MKKTGVNATIRYVGGFEDHVTDSSTTKHIRVGGLHVATRVVGGLSPGTYYPHGDHPGSLNVLTSTSGAEVQRLTYLPFGETLFNYGAVDFLKLRFTGQEEDPETGLYYYGARYYNPALGRFISADTLVPHPGDPQSLNRYSYVRNNPLNLVDPSGHDSADPEASDESGDRNSNTGGSWGGLWDAIRDAFSALRDTLESLPAQAPLDPMVDPTIPGRIGMPVNLDLVPGLKALSPEEFAELEKTFGMPVGPGISKAFEGIRDLLGQELFGQVYLDYLSTLPAMVRAGYMVAVGPFVGPFVAGATAAAARLGQLLGQLHHLISRPIQRALERHPNLQGLFKYRDARFTARAVDEEAHRGYQGWHRALDHEVSKAIAEHPEWSREDFLGYLEGVYSRPDLMGRFSTINW